MCALLLVTTLTAPASLSATHPKTAPLPPPPAPSSAPDPVKVTAGNSQIALEWPAVPGATRYHVFRGVSDVPGGGEVWEKDPVARVSGRYFKNAGLTNGFTYAYKVAGVNAGGLGPPSAVVRATPLGPPTDFKAVAGDMQVTARHSRNQNAAL